MNERRNKREQRSELLAGAASFRARAHRDGSEECVRTAPLLTALFDGEASDDEARRARHHLLACAPCAALWLEWNQTRALLRDEGAPPVPSQLAPRIRFALAKPAAPAPSSSSFIARGLAALENGASRFSPTQWSVAALGVFALMLAQNGFLPSPSLVASSASSTATRAVSFSLNATVHEAPPRVLTAPTLPLAPTANLRRMTVQVSTPTSSQSLATLDQVQRERMRLTLAPRPRLIALPMLAPLPAVPLAAHAEVRELRRRGAQAQPPAPAAWPAPRAALLAAPAFPTAQATLASVALADEAAPSRVRVLLASAPLRISTPRVRPVTVSDDDGVPSDAPGLDDLASTVQNFRSTVTPQNDAGAG